MYSVAFLWRVPFPLRFVSASRRGFCQYPFPFKHWINFLPGTRLKAELSIICSYKEVHEMTLCYQQLMTQHCAQTNLSTKDKTDTFGRGQLYIQNHQLQESWETIFIIFADLMCFITWSFLAELRSALESFKPLNVLLGCLNFTSGMATRPVYTYRIL